MSRVLGNSSYTGESGDLGSDPVKLPHFPMSGVAVIAFYDFDGGDTNFTFTVQQGPTTAGPWTRTGPNLVLNNGVNTLPIIAWLRFSSTERYVRLLSSIDTADTQQIAVMWLDDPLLHWEPAP